LEGLKSQEVHGDFSHIQVIFVTAIAAVVHELRQSLRESLHGMI
jgi:hypothetical protein